ncbi:MAG: glutathione S-transferase N-terminal domain-containing protein [Rhizomicrobium sp.]
MRWALEEAGLPYRVESTPFRERGPEHFAHQPFGQVPWLTDGGISIFESGAILLHLGERQREASAIRSEKDALRQRNGSSPRSTPSRWQAFPWTLDEVLRRGTGDVCDCQTL